MHTGYINNMSNYRNMDNIVEQMEVDSLRLHKLTDYHPELEEHKLYKVDVLNDALETYIKTYVEENPFLTKDADVYVNVQGHEATISIVDLMNDTTDFIDAEIELHLDNDLELNMSFVELSEVDYHRVVKNRREAAQYFNLDHNDWRIVRNLMFINKTYIEAK